MTDTQIPTGRELDALVAEKVFGWYRCPCTNPSCDFWVTPPDQGGDWDRMLPAFSTDIAAAWQVVEAMRARRCETTLTEDRREWECRFMPLSMEYGTIDAVELRQEAKTAPHAICLAALKAVGAL